MLALLALLSPTSTPAADELYVAVRAGDVDRVSALLAEDPDALHEEWYGDRPLDWAVEYATGDMVELLLEAGASLEAEAGTTTALHRVRHPSSVAVLVAAGAELEALDEGGVTPLSRALDRGRAAVAEELLAAGAELDLFAAIRTGRTEKALALIEAHPALARSGVAGTWRWRHPILTAAACGNQRAVEALLDAGASIEAVAGGEWNPSGLTPLGRALMAGHYELAEWLLERGAKPASHLSKGQSILAAAILHDQERAAHILIEAGAVTDHGSLHGIDELGELQLAALHGRTSVVELLLRRGYPRWADAELPPLYLAAVFGHRACAELLLADGAEPDGYVLAALGDLEGARAWFAERPDDLDRRDPLERTALFWAAWNGHETVVRSLLEVGANTDPGAPPLHVESNFAMAPIPFEGSWYSPESPLTAAVRGGHAGVVRALLEAGADPLGAAAPVDVFASVAAPVASLLLDPDLAGPWLGAQRARGLEEHAVWYDNVELVELMHARGFDLGLHGASLVGDVARVRELVSAGAPLDRPVTLEFSPHAIDYAAEYGHLEIVKLLAGAGVSLECGSHEYSPAYRAAATGKLEVLAWILDEAELVDPRGALRDAALGAIEQGRADVAELLLERDPAWRTVRLDDRRTLLHVASEHAAPACVELLLARGLDPSAPDLDALAPLHLAAAAGDPTSCALLLEAGADADAVSHFGATPLEQAERAQDAGPRDGWRFRDAPWPEPRFDEVLELLRAVPTGGARSR